MWSMFENELQRINRVMGTESSPNLPDIFSRVPLDDFGSLLFDIPSQYPNIKSFFPSMVSEQAQKGWTGSHGEALLTLSLAFSKTMISGYSGITGNRIGDAKVLDFGCGWGRLIRFLYKYVPIDNIYGVDPWEESLKLCREHRVKGNLALSDWVPTSLPFEAKFDLIFAYSVFTHLSEKTAQVVLSTLRKYISENGVLLITIRPKEFWTFLMKGKQSQELINLHNEKGFAFIPQQHRAPVNGDITFGETSMSLAYIENNFPQWKIEAVECNLVNKYQVLVFLRPV
jgi:2-polyprenyl-3-methyl-5-hydroxy-6-metoxy-1,4-benzoquinol methylase